MEKALVVTVLYCCYLFLCLLCCCSICCCFPVCCLSFICCCFLPVCCCVLCFVCCCFLIGLHSFSTCSQDGQNSVNRAVMLRDALFAVAGNMQNNSPVAEPLIAQSSFSGGYHAAGLYGRGVQDRERTQGFRRNW